MADIETLRRELDAASALRLKSDYRTRLEELKARYGHTVAVLQDGEHEMERFNCYAYALAVWSEPHYRQLVDEWRSSSLVDSEFVCEMIKDGQLAENQAEPGSLALYFAGDQLCHAGIVVDMSPDPIIQSKWGGNEVHRHKLWELPACHGNRVHFFGAPDPRAVLARLQAELEQLD